MNTEVLLINLPISSGAKKVISNSLPPLGLLYIGGYLKSKNVKCDFIDFNIERSTKVDFISYLKFLNPKIIGLSTYNEAWGAQKVFSKLAKQILPNVIIVAGGAFSTFCYEDMFKENVVDYVIRGEGEISFYNLYNLLIKNKGDIINISGLVYRNIDNRLLLNPVRRITELDKLPFPDRTLIDPSKYGVGYTISTARGCPGRCIFCSSTAFWGKRIYLRSVDSIIDEVMDIYNIYNQNSIYFADDTFTLNKARVIEFCEKIKKTGINFYFGIESRADVIDEGLIQLLKSAGFHKIQIGLESADNTILKKIKKNETIEQIEKAIRLAAKYDFQIAVSYIVGHAFDTEVSIQKTINFANYIQKKYNAHATGSINTPFPGTEQYDKAKELGIKIFSNDWDQYRLDNPIIGTSYISKDKLREYYNTMYNLAVKAKIN